MSWKSHVNTCGQKTGTCKIQLWKCELRKKAAGWWALTCHIQKLQPAKTKPCHAGSSSENSTYVCSFFFSLVDRCSVGTIGTAFILDAGLYVNKFW